MPAEIDWSLAKPLPDFLGGALNAYATGRGLAQQLGVQRALANAGTDPASAIPQLLAFGDLPAATAVSNMAFQTQQRRLLTAGANALIGGSPTSGAGGGVQTATPQPGQSAPGQNALPQAGAQPDLSNATPQQVAHIGGVLDTFDRLGVELSSLPYNQRQARIQQERPTLISQGIPQQVLDGFDPTDTNIANAHNAVAETRRHLMASAPGAAQGPGAPAPVADPNAPQAVPDAAAPPAPPVVAAPPQAGPGGPSAPSPQAGPASASAGPPPPVSPSGPTTGASQPQQGPAVDLNNPNTARALEMMALGGGDVGPIVNIGTATMPKYSATRSGLVFDEHSGKFVNAGPNDQGIVPQIDGQGNVIGARELPGYDEALANQAGAKARGEASGRLPYVGPTKRAEAAGEHAGAAPYTPIEIDNGDGTTAKGVISVGPDGTTRFTRIQPGAGAQAVPGAPGQAAPAFNQSQSTGEKAFSAEDAKNFGETVEQAGPEAQLALQSHVATAQQAVHAAMALNPNAFTPKVKQVADLFNAFGLDSSKSNELNYYSSIIPQVTRASFATFPRLEKEFELVKAAIPSMASPRDAAALTFATIAAVSQRNLDFLRFTNNYQGPHSEASLNKAWQNSPDGQKSIFAEPIYRGLTMSGKPLVYVNPNQAPNGHVYGVFRPGTPQAQTFLVQ